MATQAEKTKGFTQLSSGFWAKTSDGSSPYLFDGNNMIFMGDVSGGSGGETVNPHEFNLKVMNAIVTNFVRDSYLPIENGITLVQALGKIENSAVDIIKYINDLAYGKDVGLYDTRGKVNDLLRRIAVIEQHLEITPEQAVDSPVKQNLPQWIMDILYEDEDES